MIKLNKNLTIGNQCSLFKTMERFCDGYDFCENAQFKSYFTDLFAKNEAVILASNRQAAANSLDEADTARDTAISKFFAVLEGSAAQVDSAEAAAGEAALKVANGYGRKIMNLSFNEETTKIESLLKDFSAAENAEVLKKVHGGEAAKERLKNAQDSFVRLYATKSAAASESADDKNATALKRDLRSFYNETIVPYLQALCVLESEKYAPFAKKLDAEVAKMNATAK